MTDKLVVGTDQKPSPEQLLEMYETLESQRMEIRSQMKRGVMTNDHIRALIECRNPFPEKTTPSGLDEMHRSHAWGVRPRTETAGNSDTRSSAEKFLEMFELLDSQMLKIREQMKRGEISTCHIQALIEHRKPFSENPEISGLEGMNKAPAWGVHDGKVKTEATP